MARLHIIGSRAARNHDRGGALQGCARLGRRGDSVALLNAALLDSSRVAALAAEGLVSVFAVDYSGKPIAGIHLIGYAELVELAEEHEQTVSWP